MTLVKDKDKLFIVLLMLSLHTQGLTYIGPFDLSDLIIGIFFLKWLLINLTNPREKSIFSNLNYIPFLLIGIACIPLSYSHVSALKLFMPIKWFLVIFLLINAIKTHEKVFFAIKTFIWASFLSSIFAIIQFSLFVSQGIILLRRKDPTTMRLRFEDTSWGTFLRSSGFFDYIHVFALVAVLSFIILLYFFLSRNYKIVGKYTALFMMTTMLIAMALTFYKGVWVILILSSIFMIFYLKPSKCVHTTVGLVAFFILLHFWGITNKVINFISYEITMGIEARLQLARMGIQNFSSHPFFGIGLFNAYLYTPNGFHLPPHNAFVLVADEFGLIGLIIFLLLYCYLFLRLLFFSLHIHDINSKILLKALTVTFVAFMIYMQMEPIAYNFVCWVYFGLIEGSILFLNKKQQNVLV